MVAAGTKALLGGFSLSNPGIGETVRRTRGIVQLASDQMTTLETQAGALGLVVVTDIAFAAGAASIPGPVTEASDDGWFVWVPMTQRMEIAANPGNQIYDFDSKAMRRVEEGFTVAVMVENATASFGMRVSLAISMLTSIS